ncbi:5598_t:CDS:2, partial [Cetraspora pellucida]
MVSSKKSSGHLYKAPEILDGQTYNQASNIYSFGMLMFYLLSENIDKNYYSIWKFREYTFYDYYLPKPTWKLIKKCTDYNPNNRPATEEISSLLLSWLKSFDTQSTSGSLHNNYITIIQYIESTILAMSDIYIPYGNFANIREIGNGGYGT